MGKCHRNNNNGIINQKVKKKKTGKEKLVATFTKETLSRINPSDIRSSDDGHGTLWKGEGGRVSRYCCFSSSFFFFPFLFFSFPSYHEINGKLSFVFSLFFFSFIIIIIIILFSLSLT